MVRKDEPSIQTRKIELAKLIDYAKIHRFKPSLIREYEGQLKAIDDELKQRREHRKELSRNRENRHIAIQCNIKAINEGFKQ